MSLNIAHSRLGQFEDGVWFVELADLDANDPDLVEAIAVEIANTLNFRLGGSGKPIRQLLEHLKFKQMLLVLDNFEHIMEGADIVRQIVRQSENVQLIVTSRERLALRAENVVNLNGLTYPLNENDNLPSEAVDLFLSRMKKSNLTHHPSEESLVAIRKICRLVEGLPLAIELAAAQMRYRTVEEVASALQHSFGSLSTTDRDRPKRHRNLQIVYDMSYESLPPELQTLVANLSIFRGGFTAKAAAEIVGAQPHQLASLSDKSLLAHMPNTTRFTFHAAVREFSAEKRQADTPSIKKHTDHYLLLLADHAASLKRDKPHESIAILKPEFENIRHAWQKGLKEKSQSKLMHALPALSGYYQLLGLSYEAESVMKTSFQAAREWGGDGAALATRIGLEMIRFQNRLGKHAAAIEYAQITFGLAQAVGDSWAESMGSIHWAEACWRFGDFESAENKLNDAYQIAITLDDQFLKAWCHHHLGIVNDLQSQFEPAINHFETACELWQQLNHIQQLASSLNSIGLVYYNQGNMAGSQAAKVKALEHCQRISYRHLESILLNNLSNIAADQEDYEGAQYYLRLSLNLATESGNLNAEANARNNLGRVFVRKGQIETGLELIAESYRIAKRIGNRPIQVAAMANQAEAHRFRKSYRKARDLYEQALALAQKINNKRFEFDILTGLVRLFNELGDVSQVKEYSRQAIAVSEKTGNQIMKRRLEDLAAEKLLMTV